jgi:hypothetical protein
MSDDLKCRYSFGAGQKVECGPPKLRDRVVDAPASRPCRSGQGKPPGDMICIPASGLSSPG